ncbi:LOW QUALITY PROTEIN: microtubule-associated protein 10 [Brachyhypopomus gauderio]|uniref:LOW QUALITY PROTEIN: microtubule-associated protein 10 n=1 Tax=Brachyhypopomus gauderio TaxID=698409 RepID=UPI004040F32C
MADTHQTLFSFELFVECVRVDTRKILVEPAIAIRLLDFPTLLIYRSEYNDPMSKPGSEKVHLLSETFSNSEENGFAYSFKKGKSCLFKISLNSLHAHLSNTPLCTMLLDVRGNIPKLIGSALIPLAKLTYRIKVDVEKRGIWTPASYGEKVITPLLNLMGERVGAISLAYKIVSLGASLRPRISESRIEEMGASLKPNVTSTEDKGAHEIHPSVPENITSSAQSQPACFDEQPTDVLLSETKEANVASVTTHTKHIKTQDISVVTEVECGDDGGSCGDELLCSTFCPPPLFYSSSEKNEQHAQMENLTTAKDPEDEKSVEVEHAHHINGPKEDEDRLVSDVGVQHNHTMPSHLEEAILRLPLINALIGELSQLSDQIHHQLNPFSVHPNLVSMCTSAEQTFPTSALGGKVKTEVQKTAIDLLCPRQSKSHVPFTGQQERPYHKKKLSYGLTHTFHLRLKQVKLAMTKQNECKEQFKTEQLLSQKNTSRTKKYNSTRQKRDQNEPVEKLFNNFQIDPAPLNVVSKVKKTTTMYKNLTKQAISSNSLKAKGLYYKADKEVQVHIPSTLSPVQSNPDHTDGLSASDNHTSSIYINQTYCDMMHSRESDREASNHDSVESDEYQEDFTSLDPTEASPDPLSSPELGRSQRGHVSSDSSSSGSYFHRNTSHPVFVKTSHSPKSHSKVPMIKAHVKSSVLSTSSDNKSFSASISTTSTHRQMESQSFPRSLNLSSSFKKSKCVQGDDYEESIPVREQSIGNFLSSNDFVLQSVSSPDPDEEKDELASLGIQNKCQPMSDLLINKLPGYTL